MLETLQQLDQTLLLWINETGSPYLDEFMWIISQKETWYGLYLALIITIFGCFDFRKALLFIVVTAICIALADQISSGLIKPLIERLRPTHNPSISGMVNVVNDYRGGLYGFVSSHAANSFAFASLISLLFKWRPLTITASLWALIVSYSRAYLGVHYPGDLIGGAIIGVLVAWICFMIFKRILKTHFFENQQQAYNYGAKIAFLAFVVNIMIVIIFTKFMA